MDETEAELLTRVTYHAVTRYVQRVLNFPPIARGADGSHECALAHAASAGRSIEDIRRLILTPAVRLAIQHGARAVRGSSFYALLAKSLAGDGRTVVISIYPRSPVRRSSAMTRSEWHRKAQAAQRRLRHRPSPSIGPREIAELVDS